MTTLKQPDRVTVVIVTYNGVAWIGQCLDSIFRGTVSPSVVVVDNASTDDTVEIIRSTFPKVSLIENEQNLGFGQANNLGICEALRAKADFVFLLNQDTTINDDTISRLLRAFQESDDKYAIFSPVHFDGSGEALDFGFASYIADAVPNVAVDELISDKKVRVFEVDFVNAAAWMIRADVFRRIGGFAPLFFHYGEDRDFVSRLHFHGLKIAVATGCEIRHYREARNMDVSSWTDAKLQRYYYTGWLARSCDMRKTLSGGWFAGFRWAFGEGIAAIFKAKFRIIAVVTWTLIKVVRVMPDIREHRNSVKDPEPFSFLS